MEGYFSCRVNVSPSPLTALQFRCCLCPCGWSSVWLDSTEWKCQSIFVLFPLSEIHFQFISTMMDKTVRSCCFFSYKPKVKFMLYRYRFCLLCMYELYTKNVSRECCVVIGSRKNMQISQKETFKQWTRGCLELCVTDINVWSFLNFLSAQVLSRSDYTV